MPNNMIKGIIEDLDKKDEELFKRELPQYTKCLGVCSAALCGLLSIQKKSVMLDFELTHKLQETRLEAFLSSLLSILPNLKYSISFNKKNKLYNITIELIEKSRKGSFYISEIDRENLSIERPEFVYQSVYAEGNSIKKSENCSKYLNKVNEIYIRNFQSIKLCSAGVEELYLAAIKMVLKNEKELKKEFFKAEFDTCLKNFFRGEISSVIIKCNEFDKDIYLNYLELLNNYETEFKNKPFDIRAKRREIEVAPNEEIVTKNPVVDRFVKTICIDDGEVLKDKNSLPKKRVSVKTKLLIFAIPVLLAVLGNGFILYKQFGNQAIILGLVFITFILILILFAYSRD